MSYLPYQFIACTPEQWVEVQALISDLGAPDIGPDGRLLANRNGNLPIDDAEQAALERLGCEVVPDWLIKAWKQDNGWEIDPRGGA